MRWESFPLNIPFNKSFIIIYNHLSHNACSHITTYPARYPLKQRHLFIICVYIIHRNLSDLRNEVAEGISSMSLKVKFDLLHDETPQVWIIICYPNAPIVKIQV